MRFVRGLEGTPGTNLAVVKTRWGVSVTGLFCFLAIFLSACGGGPSPHPVPTLTSISPATATREGPAFTLTVNGSNFVSGASVQWNGKSRPTTFVSSTQVTAQIETADILVAQTYNVAVVNPSPGGGTSNSLTFDVPCVLATQGPASTQTLARIGAYYFDGWAGPLTGFHFQGLVNSPYQGREPLSGWQDNNQCAIEQQLAWAHSFGLSFFVFDWYFNATAVDTTGEDLNSALKITQGLADRHGIEFAILYVNQDPFVVEPSDWTTAVTQWVSYMVNPGYVRVNGKPLFVVIDMPRMRVTFGSSAATVAAFDELRTAAQAKGLPGVYIAGDIFVGAGASGIDGLFPDLSSALTDGYDAVTMYGIGALELPLTTTGEQPFSGLAGVAKWIWNEGGLKSPIPFIPLVPDGDDPRSPEGDHYTDRPLYWFSRTPQDVATLVVDAITWAESNPRVLPESPLAPPVILIGTWNELGNGAYLVPTVDDGTSYGDALAAMLSVTPTRIRSVLTVVEDGPSAPNRTATGRLTDSTGSANAGASVVLTATPVDGGGVYAEYKLSGVTPAAATAAVVGFRVNLEGAGPGASDFSLYRVSYLQGSDGIERVTNGDFSSGGASWGLGGQSQLVASDRGAGDMVLVETTRDQIATLTSAPFAVTEASAFGLTFTARVAPSSTGSGYFTLIFLEAGVEFLRELIPFRPEKVALGSTTTDTAGGYSLELGALGNAAAVLEATYPGDAQHWPAYARVGP